MLDSAVQIDTRYYDANIEFGTKGKFFVGLPIDIGFDFIRAGRGGARLFFRLTPEFHENGTAIPIGLVLQVWNWKVYSKK
jgi:hypothetical protein